MLRCDLDTFFTALLTSVGGTGVALAAAYFLGKKWLGTRIEESIKHEYAKELEEHKAQLTEQVNRSLSQIQREANDADEQRKTDKELFEQFLALLPSSRLNFLYTAS